jgi:predicted nucleotidyltransferase
MLYGLDENNLVSILDILRTNTKIDEIILFGSRAKGIFDPGSDIDLAIKGKELTLDDIISLKARLNDLSILNKIDLVIYDRINEPALIDHINRVGILLFKKATENKAQSG